MRQGLNLSQLFFMTCDFLKIYKQIKETKTIFYLSIESIKQNNEKNLELCLILALIDLTYILIYFFSKSSHTYSELL